MFDQEVGFRFTSYGVEPVFPTGEAPRVTLEEVLAEIADESYTVLPSGRVTVCEITLRNGFTVRGESGVVFIENNIPELGRKYARERAIEQIWQLLGFRLREREWLKLQGTTQEKNS